MPDGGKQATVEDGLLTTHSGELEPLSARIFGTQSCLRSEQVEGALDRLKRPLRSRFSSFLNGANVVETENQLLLEQMLALAKGGPSWQGHFGCPKACNHLFPSP